MSVDWSNLIGIVPLPVTGVQIVASRRLVIASARTFPFELILYGHLVIAYIVNDIQDEDHLSQVGFREHRWV